MVHRRRGRRTVAAIGALGLAAGALVASGSAPAGAITVTTEPLFRAAWINPNETQITLDADITLTQCLGGAPTRNSAVGLTVTGNGHTITQTCPESVLEQFGNGGLTFDGVTLTGGTAPLSGGGLLDVGMGAVAFTNSTVSGNTAGDSGGGISTNGAVTLTNSTVSGNHADTFGGGIYTNSALTLTNSTVNGNTADTGGGGISAKDTVTLTNSTVNGNTADTFGGGIYAFGIGGIGANGTVTLTNSTVSGNSGTEGGGISAGTAGISAGTVTLVYATVVGNSAASGANLAHVDTLVPFGSVVAVPQGGGANCVVDVTTSNGFNFSDDASCELAGPGDRQNAGDPSLGALANNGGPTQTRLPQTSSPLVDAIPAGSCQADGASGITSDQRGVPRPQGVGCDIGAVEVVPPSPGAAVPIPAVVRFTG